MPTIQLLFSPADLDSAHKLFQLLDKFKKVSGLKVNSSKTEGMWIGSLKGSEMKPLGIKWPQEPIKALGVSFSYDKKLLYSKNFLEKIDNIKTLINIWSSRGLSLYGKVAIIKTLLLPKVVYVSSLMPTPKHIIDELTHLVYNFLWKGKDKVTRASAINNFEGGGIKMVDIESMIKSLRLSWLKRIFCDNAGAWKKYLEYILKDSGGLMLFNCNCNVKDLNISSLFYTELLKWWCEFREDNAADNNWHYFIWNNQEIRINNKPVFYKRYHNYGIQTVSDLRFDLNNIDSYELIAKNIERTNFLEWTGLRHSVPFNLRNLGTVRSDVSPSFKIDNGLFDVTKKKSKDYYSLLVLKKARLPNYAQKLKCEFNLSDEELKKAFLLPHSVAFEPYVKAFQFKVLNSILYTNSKLCKIGFIADNLCSFCKHDSETMQHLFYDCPHSRSFWKEFESHYLSLTKQQVHLNLKDILIGVLTPKCLLLNYLLLIGKIYLWGCRGNKELPNIQGFKFKVNLKYETEKYICTKNKNLDKLMEKWKM